jgi:hypothetical protein
MSNSKPRFSLEQMAKDDIEIPQNDLVSRPVVDILSRSATTPPVINSEPVATSELRFTTTKHDEGAVVDLATTRFLPNEEREKTSLSIPKSLNRLLNAKVYELKARGFSKITREAVIEDALKLYFGIKA